MESVAKRINAVGKAVLVIGDTHLPYEHHQYLAFCKAVAKKYRCIIHIHIGDEADGHAISFHKSDESLLNAGDELLLTIERFKAWNKAFPKLKLLESNHGSLIFRRMKVEGIPVRFIKPLQEIYETPKWSWWHDILLKTSYGEIYLCHGKSAGYGMLAREMGCSAIQGHFHGKLEVTWHQKVEHRRFNMFVGCGINWNSMAFAYGKNNLPKPILGCGVIDAEGLPHVIKMKLGKKGNWTGKL